MSDDRARFDTLLFLLACNKLDGDDAAWMEAQLQRDPALAREASAERVRASELRAAVAALYAEMPPLLSYEELMSARAALAPQRRAAPWPGLPSWLGETMLAARRWCAPAWPGGVVALLTICLGVQSYRVEQRDQMRRETAYRGGAVQAGDGVLLRAVFIDAATLGQLGVLADTSHLQIVAGPDPQGIVLLRATDGRAQHALEALRASALVLDVSIVGQTRAAGEAR